MNNTKIQKECAIEQHSRQAGAFAERYRHLSIDPYQNCFTYSRHRLEACLDHVLPQRGEGLRLLDIGCGTGHHLARLRQRGFEVAGVDGSPEMLAQARLSNPEAEIRQGDVEEIPFPDGSFDVVLCIEVLRYLPHPARCVREMARVLKPGGVCLATAAPLFNLNGYWLINRLANRIPLGDLVRLKQFFTLSGKLRREFRRAGFVLPRVRGVYLGPVNWVERLTPWAIRRFLKAWEPLDAAVADWPLVREFSNMYLIHALRSG